MKLLSPLDGWCLPLDETPDEAFAGRLLGDGLSIDPTAPTLHAPCDAEVIAVPATRHAITLHAEGADILLHVGIDTVGLGGEGFELLTRPGARVRAGEPLLRFDLDLIARRARSLVTPIVLTDGGSFVIASRRTNAAVRTGQVIMELAAREHAGEKARTGAGESCDARASIAFEHGLHARPAALVASCARRFTAEADLEVRGRTANARSIVSLMALGAGHGDEVRIRARGADAVDACRALAELLSAGDRVAPGSGESKTKDRSERPIAAATGPHGHDRLAMSKSVADRPGTLRGIVAYAGLAVGPATPLERPDLEVAEEGRGIARERAALEAARAAVAARLRALAASPASATRDIMLAHVELLGDPEILAAADRLLEGGKSAGFAWREALRAQARRLAQLDERLAARIDDLRDIQTSVLAALHGTSAHPAASALPEDAIVIARDLLPSQLAALEATRIAGVCLAEGGATSHVAILAAAMGIPMLVACGARLLGVPGGSPLVLDANEGLLHVAPDPDELARARSRLVALRQRAAREREVAQRECRTADGVRIELFANVGSVVEAEAAVKNGAEGCGLLRTEFLFQDRDTPPSEAEQTAEYERIVATFGDKPVVIRTLDVGGDKPIAYLPLPSEPNPALGLRGIRTSLWRPDLLRAQLAAVLRVQPHGRCRLLLPMVVNAAEVRAVRGLLAEVAREAGLASEMQVGAMIETPAAALMAEEIAAEADFLSVGTNDLTQYTLAMDRGHPELAGQIDALHPAVLRLIAAAAQGARGRGRPLAVCGGLAGEPLAAPVLLGLGVTELSVVPSAVPHLKALIATLSLATCREIAAEALESPSAEAVRAVLARALPRAPAVAAEGSNA